MAQHPTRIDSLIPFLKMWSITPDGELILTHTSQLLAVKDKHGAPMMLKVTQDEAEREGAMLMRWWHGRGAARVIDYQDGALLMARADGRRCLLKMAQGAEDDEASRIICRVVEKLHSSPGTPPASLVPLGTWFDSLLKADGSSPLISACRDIAVILLAEPQNSVALHGDIHHGNILDFGESGWLAIDPKGLLGERGYDYANLFCNPELSTATNKSRFLRQLDIIVEAASIDRTRLLQWIMAYAGLSACWFLEDADTVSAHKLLTVARFAQQCLLLPRAEPENHL